MKIFLLIEWTDFYTDGSEGTDLNSTINKTQRNDLSSYENAYVHDCSFSYVSGSSYGGVIYYSIESKLLIERSSFKSCNSTSHGGVIYINGRGDCVISFVCAVKCNTYDSCNGQFCYVMAGQNENYKNYILDSSITLTEQINGRYTFRHRYGNILCQRVNASNNEVSTYSGIYIENTPMSSISFSSFRNNTADDYSCICYDMESNTLSIINTNIIENEQKAANFGIIHSRSGTTSMTYCSIYGNKEGSGKVFYANDGSTIICKSCSMKDDQKNSVSGSVSINTVYESF